MKKENSTVLVDVMTNHWRTFYCTLRYTYCPLFNFDMDKMVKWVTAKLPSLLYRTDAVIFAKFPEGSEYKIKINN